MDKKVIVIYHTNCYDGFCGAWVFHTIYGNTAEYIPMGYGSPYDLNDFRGKDVFIVDFSFKREETIYLRGITNNLLVLDHHKSAKKELEGLSYCKFDMKKSGGRLAWEYFFPSLPPNWLVRYTEDRDLWNHQLPNTHEINAVLKSYPFDFQLWDAFSYIDPKSWVTEGEAILRTIDNNVRFLYRFNERHLIGGHVVRTINSGVYQSEIGHYLAEKHGPFGAVYFRNHGQWQYSLRGDGTIDVSEIAKQYGGGGHHNAAGFSVKELLNER